MPEFGSPFSGLANDRKLTDAELIRAIRFMVAAEYEAIQMYMQLAESTDNSLAIEVLQDMSKIEYKGRDPFNDADCLAQVYLDAWAARAELRKFYERMIEDPRALSAHYRRFYEENYDKPRKENNSAP